MGEQTKISWCDATWNPWRGCTKVSDGCKNCYAEKLVVNRLGGEWGKGAPRIRSESATFNWPLRWNKKPWVCDECGSPHAHLQENVPGSLGQPIVWCHHEGFSTDYRIARRRRVFSLSLGDWLDDEVPIEWLADMLDVIRRCTELDFLLLTKRIELWKQYLRAVNDRPLPHNTSAEFQYWLLDWLRGKSPPNIWLGVSVENQATADERIPKLLEIPAAVRFVSYEPALEAVSFQPSTFSQQGKQIDWLIVGGESGPKARACNVEWLRNAQRQVRESNLITGRQIRLFVKQMGSNCIDRNDAGFDGESPHEWPMDTQTKDLDPAIYQGAPVRILLRDPKGGDMREWPEDLRVREFPESPRESHAATTAK